MTTQQELIDTAKRISGYVHQTPVLTSESINEIFGASIYLKCENFQKMGAFKMRGATNAILSLSIKERDLGVVTHSSGNFAQAVALAAKKTGTKATIVMPTSAPEIKKKAVLGYGAAVIDCAPTQEAREQAAAKVQEETGSVFLHPSNQIEVINGNATAAMELMEQVDPLDAIFTPVGGGGLLAGTALAAFHFGEKTSILGGEPEGADDAFQSLMAGQIVPVENPKTIADGLRTSLGDVNFPIIKELVEAIYLVSEQEIIDAMRLIWERMKIIIEPSSAVPIAALYKHKDRFKNKRIGVIVSGGNVDLNKLPF
ncbi:pyridoxal-phosphate dependent enzyme [Flavobacteriales bacterium]|nr:pyridoxal-phosphate dependent enzyme [Flavobacteriales bacterium]